MYVEAAHKNGFLYHVRVQADADELKQIAFAAMDAIDIGATHFLVPDSGEDAPSGATKLVFVLTDVEDQGPA